MVMDYLIGGVGGLFVGGTVVWLFHPDIREYKEMVEERFDEIKEMFEAALEWVDDDESSEEDSKE